MTIERDTYTTLSQANTGSTANQYLSINLTNATVFEFDVCVTFTNNFNVVSFRQNSTNKLAITATDCGLVTDTWSHIRITVDNGTVSLNVDGVDKTTKTLTDTVNRLYIILSGIVFKYKDFLVYPA